MQIQNQKKEKKKRKEKDNRQTNDRDSEREKKRLVLHNFLDKRKRRINNFLPCDDERVYQLFFVSVLFFFFVS
jgi:hypothetical protein